MIPKYQFYINGYFLESKDKDSIVNPSTGRVIAEASVATVKEAELAVVCAREAFDKGPWPRLSLEARKDLILKISKGILDKAADLAKIESENSGKPIKECTFMDIPSSAAAFKYFADNLEAFLGPKKKEIVSQIANASAELLREPAGVVVLIVPWNYPLLIASWKLAQALAAGNTVVLKPSSLTPLSVLELAKIIHEAGFPAGVINIISGSGSKIGEAICRDKRVDMISFTGSNDVGRKILEYSSQNVKKSIMELGGKSASIIFEDCDLDVAVNSSLCSVFLNQGQMCTAMSRILVESSIYDKFVESFVDKAKRIKLGISTDFETQMGPLASETQRNRMTAYIEKAKAEGAKVVCGGKAPSDAHLRNGTFFMPTVIVDLNPRSHAFHDECFGPVVCINRFADHVEAVELANNSNFGLAACIWTADIAKAQSLAKKLNAGAVWINTYGMFYNELPYGGFKQSGFGKELGEEGFLEYTRLKNVVLDKTLDAKPLVNYWYGL